MQFRKLRLGDEEEEYEDEEEDSDESDDEDEEKDSNEEEDGKEGWSPRPRRPSEN